MTDPNPSAPDATEDGQQKGPGGQLVWPGLLRKLDCMDPSYRD